MLNLLNCLAVCDNNYCKNDGHCRVIDTGDPRCSCALGYNGGRCSNCKYKCNIYNDI